jgi:hypothetical protein
MIWRFGNLEMWGLENGEVNNWKKGLPVFYSSLFFTYIPEQAGKQ